MGAARGYRRRELQLSQRLTNTIGTAPSAAPVNSAEPSGTPSASETATPATRHAQANLDGAPRAHGLRAALVLGVPERVPLGH